MTTDNWKRARADAVASLDMLEPFLADGVSTSFDDKGRLVFKRTGETSVHLVAFLDWDRGHTEQIGIEVHDDD